MTSPGLGMLFGFINTTTLHLAKGMQRQGIETLRWRSTPRHDRSKGKAAIYVIGVILNNMAAVWIILANRFAAPAYATGMFGLGLVVLLLYSHFLLDEPVRPINYVGAALVIVGTAVFALHALRNRSVQTARFDPIVVGIFAASFVLAAFIVVVFAMRSGRPFRIALAFGIFAGGLGSLDPVLKSLGQTAGLTAGIIPTAAWGWIPFGISFLFGTTAFFSVQYAFYHGADASAMVPVQTSVYVLTPVVVQIIALPGYQLTLSLTAGIAIILLGIVLTQMGRRAIPPVAASVEEDDGSEQDSPTEPGDHSGSSERTS
ncbi:MAG: hypothetical protein ACOC1U_10105 [Spirochaetota bacterium]